MPRVVASFAMLHEAETLIPNHGSDAALGLVEKIPLI